MNEDSNYGNERAWVELTASFLECIYGGYNPLHNIRGYLLVILAEPRESSFHLFDDALGKSAHNKEST